MNYLKRVWQKISPGKSSKNLERVLILTSSFGGCGGCEIISKSIALGLQKLQISVDVITHAPEYSFNYRKNGKWTMHETVEELLLLLEHYSIVHIHTTWFAQAWKGGLPKILKKTRCPMVYSCHSLSLAQEVPWRETRETMTKAQEEIMEQADAVIHMTPSGEELAKAHYPKFSDKTVVIPNGITLPVDKDKNKVKEIRAELCPKNEFLLLYAGRVIREKGVFELVDAYNKLRQKYDVSMVLVGAGYAWHEIKKRIKGVDGLMLLGSQEPEKLSQYYHAADAVVIPSYTESFCLVAAEAMAHNTPVLITKTSGPTEAYFLNDQTQRLAIPIEETKSATAIVNAFEYLQKNKKEVTAIQERALSHVRKQYPAQRMVSRTKELYEQLIRN